MKTASANSVIPRFRAYHGKEIVLGPGKAELLEHIDTTGSISEAARLMGMSYNRAWLHVKIMNESFREPLVNSTRGGTSGGGAALSETGKKALALYKKMEEQASKATAKTERELLGLFRR
jgi:molybdate transport system regulatory protein